MRLTRKTWVRQEIGIESDREHPDPATRDAQQARAVAIYEEIGTEVGREVAALFDTLDSDRRPMFSVIGGLTGTNLVEATPFPGQPVPPLTSGLLLDRTLRVPLMISGTDIEEDRRHEVIELVDLLPTLLDRIEARRPARTVGENLLSTDPDPIAYAQFGDMRSIRMGPYLLTWRAFVHGASTLDPRVTHNIPNALQSPHRLFLHRIDEDPMQEIELKESELDVLRALLIELYRRELLYATPPEELMSPENVRALQTSASDGYW